MKNPKSKTKSPKLMTEFTREIKAFKKMIRQIDKKVLIYFSVGIILLLIVLIINYNAHTKTCRMLNKTDQASYEVVITFRYHKHQIQKFKYKTKYLSHTRKNKELASIYDTILNNLRTRAHFSQIVRSHFFYNQWRINYSFEPSNFENAIDYIGIDLIEYQDNFPDFITEMEKVGFECH